MISTDIKDKDMVAARLAAAALISYSQNAKVKANMEQVGVSWHADQALAFFSYIRKALEDGNQIPQLPQGR
jgi:hypothetical protein